MRNFAEGRPKHNIQNQMKLITNLTHKAFLTDPISSRNTMPAVSNKWKIVTASPKLYEFSHEGNEAQAGRNWGGPEHDPGNTAGDPK